MYFFQWEINYDKATFNSLMFLRGILHGNFQLINEFLLLGLVYYIILVLVNRFWIASQFFVTLSVILPVIEKFKVVSRSETILPSDLGLLQAEMLRT